MAKEISKNKPQSDDNEEMPPIRNAKDPILIQDSKTETSVKPEVPVSSLILSIKQNIFTSFLT